MRYLSIMPVLFAAATELKARGIALARPLRIPATDQRLKSYGN